MVAGVAPRLCSVSTSALCRLLAGVTISLPALFCFGLALSRLRNRSSSELTPFPYGASKAKWLFKLWYPSEGGSEGLCTVDFSFGRLMAERQMGVALASSAKVQYDAIRHAIVLEYGEKLPYRLSKGHFKFWFKQLPVRRSLTVGLPSQCRFVDSVAKFAVVSNNQVFKYGLRKFGLESKDNDVNLQPKSLEYRHPVCASFSAAEPPNSKIAPLRRNTTYRRLAVNGIHPKVPARRLKRHDPVVSQVPDAIHTLRVLLVAAVPRWEDARPEEVLPISLFTSEAASTIAQDISNNAAAISELSTSGRWSFIDNCGFALWVPGPRPPVVQVNIATAAVRARAYSASDDKRAAPLAVMTLPSSCLMTPSRHPVYYRVDPILGSPATTNRKGATTVAFQRKRSSKKLPTTHDSSNGQDTVGSPEQSVAGYIVTLVTPARSSSNHGPLLPLERCAFSCLSLRSESSQPHSQVVYGVDYSKKLTKLAGTQ
eukprot:GHVT01008076.1.p1 GENE.GHVT01008076.1~~GHVT01008076.1.p1  ORF type:complete len:484 (+),score=43.11 GHVT01008076.1:73-1524(+)